MDTNKIKQIVQEQLEVKDIAYENISILEQEFGYVIEVKCESQRCMNELFDKYGNILYPFGDLNYYEKNPGSIYNTVVCEDPNDGMPFTISPDVRFKRLDDNHFIIPRLNEGKKGSGLFFVDKDNKIKYKGYIKGEIYGNILEVEKYEQLIKTKQFLVCNEIDVTREESEYFFYSYDRNCRTSDKWSNLVSPKMTIESLNILLNKMKLPEDLAQEIIKYMQLKGAWLATLNLNSKNNEHHSNFASLIGIAGIPLIDLTYISPTYQVKTIQLKKERIGEVDTIKQLLQERMDMQVSQIEYNKNNLTANFFKTVGLGMNQKKGIEDMSGIGED